MPIAIFEAAWLEVGMSSKNSINNVKENTVSFHLDADFEEICHIKSNDSKIRPLNYLI